MGPGRLALSSGRACSRCLARAWLLGALSGHLDAVRARIDELLTVDDVELIAAVGGRRRGELERGLESFDPDRARARADEAGLELLCRCDPAYPARLSALRMPPTVLHVAGGLARFQALAAADPVAIVGSRKASPYGLDAARALGRDLACAGVTVVSGLALGIDSAAHAGALSAEGPTIAVLPGPAERPYPPARRAVYQRLRATAAVVSELSPGVAVRRWMFPARNRLIAGLAAMTVVVEAGARSGALLTAGYARELERPVGAVPGRVTSAQAAGPNELLARGACVVRGAQDALDALFGAGTRTVRAQARPPLSPELARLLAAIASGSDTAASLHRAGLAPEQGLAALAELELSGYIRREPGGRFAVTT
jgi:DNA processing protein